MRSTQAGRADGSDSVGRLWAAATGCGSDQYVDGSIPQPNQHALSPHSSLSSMLRHPPAAHGPSRVRGRVLCSVEPSQKKEKPKRKPTNFCRLVSPSARIGQLPHRAHRTVHVRFSEFCLCLSAGTSWWLCRSLSLRRSSRARRTASRAPCRGGRWDAHCTAHAAQCADDSDSQCMCSGCTAKHCERRPLPAPPVRSQHDAAQSVPFRPPFAAPHSLTTMAVMSCACTPLPQPHTRATLLHTLDTSRSSTRARDVRSGADG